MVARLGVLGVTFDPIHLGHLLVAEAARDRLRLERVLFTPAGDPPHKQQNKKSAASHRRTMVELAIADNACFELCPVDLERPGPHYSVDTVRLIREQFEVAAEDCFFIIGGDSLEDLPDWHRPQTLIRVCRLAVIQRPGYRPDVSHLARRIPGLAKQLDWIASPTIDLSGTNIRENAAEGRSLRYQVPDPVRAYIDHNGLYR